MNQSAHETDRQRNSLRLCNPNEPARQANRQNYGGADRQKTMGRLMNG